MYRILFLLPLLFMASLLEAQEKYKQFELIRFEEAPDSSIVWIIRRQGDGLRPKMDTYHQHYKDDTGIKFSKTKNVCVWVAPPGNYDVDIICLDNGSLSMDYKVVTIEGTAPTPPKPDPVNPNPPNPVPPNPDPVNPNPIPPEPGTLGYSKIAFDTALPLKVSQSTAKSLANNYQAVSSAIRAGGIVDVSKAFEDVARRNAETMASASDKAKWESWFSTLESQIEKDWDSNKIKSRDDVAQVFKEISVGLNAL